MSLPLDKFLRCIVHSDLSVLVISGHPKEAEIAEAWANIYAQYIDISNENDPIYIIELEREITLLFSHISETETAILILNEMYHEGTIRILKANGYRDKMPEDKTERRVVLAGIENKLAIKKLSYDTKKKQYDDYIKTHEKDEVTEKHFIKTLVVLAKYQGVAVIRAKDISVLEYVILLKDYHEYVQMQQGLTEKQ